MRAVNNKITLALYFGNRGFFPGEVVATARKEMCEALDKANINHIAMDESKTRFGAVETIEEGRAYAEFLEENRGKFDGVVVCMPNFSDENGALIALENANVPILIQAYPDKIGEMDFAHRRDSMCGKFALCNVLRQANIPFSLTKKFVVSPLTEDFHADLLEFEAVCRVVKGMKKFRLGAIGARTTAFKTVRVDEIAFQNKGVDIVTLDLSEIFQRAEKLTQKEIDEKKSDILAITEFSDYPEAKLDNMAKVQAVFEDVVREYQLDAVAVRCWNEFQTVMGIAPCTTLCILNEMGISAACEVDIPNAVMMRALSLASDTPSMLLDYNNNYGEEENKAIMFHCGPVAPSMLNGKGKIIEHLMFKKSFGEGSGVGVNKGSIKSGDITFGSIKTENGQVCGFVTEGRFTDDEIEEEFFGSGKVVEKEGLSDLSNYVAESGYKHHLSITYGNCSNVIFEAFSKYLDYDIDLI